MMSGRNMLGLQIDKKCNTCKIKETFKWHWDRWGRIGLVCHNCYNSILMREKKPIIRKKCNTCGADETSVYWHRDKWGLEGHVCHTCYNSIRHRERRTFDTKIKRNRPLGLVYKKRQQRKN